MTTMPLKRIASPPMISTDLWGEEESIESKYAVLNTLTVAQYIRWIKKNARQYGRGSEFGNGCQNAVEVFVKEVTGIVITFSASGEISVSGECAMLLSGWSDVAYYTYDDSNGEEDAVFVTTFGKALKFAERQSEQPFVVSWDFQG